MQCPVCDVTLSISSREGIEIDFCPQCRGVWLDRGELDKIIERAGPVGGPAYEEARRPEPRYDDRRRDDDRGYDERGHGGERYDKRKRRRSLLEDLFDFD